MQLCFFKDAGAANYITIIIIIILVNYLKGKDLKLARLKEAACTVTLYPTCHTFDVNQIEALVQNGIIAAAYNFILYRNYS